MKNKPKLPQRQEQYLERRTPVSETPPAGPTLEGRLGGADGEAGLLYLYSNNSIEKPVESIPTATQELTQGLISVLSPYYKKSAHTLYSNVYRLISMAPTKGHVGFLTLTFPDNVTDPREAYNRFRSLNSNYLSKCPDIVHWINVKERQKRGSWHYHLLVILREDIRTGFDFEAIKTHDYSSASPYLSSLWCDIRYACKKYGFGRSELLPIKSNADAMGRYIGKYISKHMGQRETRDKGVRLVNSSRGWPKDSSKFAWYNSNSILWRFKVNLFAQFMGCTELYQLTEKLGSDWAFNYSTLILNIETILEEKALFPPHVTPEIESLQKIQKSHRQNLNLVRHKRAPRFSIAPAFAEYQKQMPLIDALYDEYILKQKEPPNDSGESLPGVPF